MTFAPAAQRVCIGLGEPLCQMIVVMVAGQGDLPIRQFPEHLRQMIQETFPIGLAEGILKIIRIRNQHILFFFRLSKGLFVGKLGLIGKNGRNHPAEFFAHGLQIFLMGHFNKTFCGLLIQCIDIGFIVKPRTLRRQFQVGIPDIGALFPICQPPVFA